MESLPERISRKAIPEGLGEARAVERSPSTGLGVDRRLIPQAPTRTGPDVRRPAPGTHAQAAAMGGAARIAGRQFPQSRVLCVVNRKGGVGKTTCSFNLAGALAHMGHQVLVVDLDPMGSLCRSLQIFPGKNTLSDVLVGVGGQLGDLIRPTHIRNLSVIPGDPNLRTLEMRNGTSVGLRLALREKLSELLKQKPYPYVIIDCPPSLGLISGNALIAATEALIPVDGSTYGMGPLLDTLGIIKLVRNNVNRSLSISGILLNNIDMGTLYDRTVQEVLRQQYGAGLFRTVVPYSPEADESSQLGEPVVRYSPQCWMAKSYMRLVEEILARRPRNVL
jgi:chromosome partitioning protein